MGTPGAVSQRNLRAQTCEQFDALESAYRGYKPDHDRPLGLLKFGRSLGYFRTPAFTTQAHPGDGRPPETLLKSRP
jgi:hypothetical protein